MQKLKEKSQATKYLRIAGLEPKDWWARVEHPHSAVKATRFSLGIRPCRGGFMYAPDNYASYAGVARSDSGLYMFVLPDIPDPIEHLCQTIGMPNALIVGGGVPLRYPSESHPFSVLSKDVASLFIINSVDTGPFAISFDSKRGEIAYCNRACYPELMKQE